MRRADSGRHRFRDHNEHVLGQFGWLFPSDEPLFVVVTESAADAEPLNLEGFVDNCSINLNATRGGEAQRAVSFLIALRRRPDTRDDFGGLDISNVWVTPYAWQVLPRQVLDAASPPATTANTISAPKTSS